MSTSDTSKFARLRRFNIVMGLFHAVQGIAILALANEFALPVTATFLNGPPGESDAILYELFEVRIAWGVAAFIFMSAIAHWLISSPGIYPWYVRNLKKGRNYARWIEYSASSSVMVVLIAMLPGISDVAALGSIFAVNAMMILFGLLMEHYEQPGRPNWMSYWFGVLAGAVPWIVIALYLWSPSTDGSPPAFVYGIFVSLFVFFNTFAINMVLQYRQVGKWKDYLYGERAYIVLSLIAKSLLAWQVFAGTLAPTS
ncbi:MAG: heliorhodopsin HeR [Acidimicrobiia bacterium]|nr:heliorhodopsin HeR [Acidimicrobiia bacterium]MDX2466846.1 heliorhodopsin HeR [Acidimicrobiia bacterium]